MAVSSSTMALLSALLQLAPVLLLLLLPCAVHATSSEESPSDSGLSRLRGLRSILQDTKGSAQPWRPYFIQHACERTLLRITCPRRSRIYISRAMYGHSAYAQCPGANARQAKDDESSSCRGLMVSQRANRILSDVCNGEARCEVPVISYLFGDPCPNSPKYLEVYYYCGGESASTSL